MGGTDSPYLLYVIVQLVRYEETHVIYFIDDACRFHQKYRMCHHAGQVLD